MTHVETLIERLRTYDKAEDEAVLLLANREIIAPDGWSQQDVLLFVRLAEQSLTDMRMRAIEKRLRELETKLEDK